MSEPPYEREPYPQRPSDPQYPPPGPGGQQPPPPYGAPPPYGTPPPYGPPPGYGAPPPGYGAPAGYGAPPGYGGYGGYGGPRLAHWGQRLGSYLLDGLIPLPLVVIAAIVIAAGSTPATVTRDANGDIVELTPATGPGAVALTVGILLYLASFGVTFYNRWIRQGRTGQSWGKQALKLRLLGEETGQPIGGGMAFVRDLAHILDSLACYLGWLWPLWDAKRQTFADKLTKTVVTAEG
jgi:uncharacterized RDD family membrane protein YckC